MLSNKDTSLFDWLAEVTPATPKKLHEGLATTALPLPWMIWKDRNNRVFDLWPQASALGLTTWDEIRMEPGTGMGTGFGGWKN
jgi:hypothetical protein